MRAAHPAGRIDRGETGRLDVGLQDHEGAELLPACVKSCPTNALQFADQGDTPGPVHEYFEEANQQIEDRHAGIHPREGSRVYRLLEEMGTKPNVIYLKKVDLYPLKKTTHA